MSAGGVCAHARACECVVLGGIGIIAAELLQARPAEYTTAPRASALTVEMIQGCHARGEPYFSTCVGLGWWGGRITRPGLVGPA